MKENKNKPGQVLTYNANASAKIHLQTKLASGQTGTENPYLKLDDNHKLVRRYSIDDNGGGYRGL